MLTVLTPGAAINVPVVSALNLMVTMVLMDSAVMTLTNANHDETTA